jgi:FSR family fosmidomycin resistance protein-like MFS transporter
LRDKADGQEFQQRRVLTITLGHLANDMYPSFLPALLPLFIANLGLSKTEAGLLSLIRQAPSLAQPAMGHLADRFNLRGVLVLTPAVTAVMFSLLGVAPSYTALAVLLVLGGTSTVAFHAIAPALAGELAGSKNMGRGMGLWILGGELGFTLGPLLLVSVVERFGPRATPSLMGFGMLGTVALFLRLRDIPQRGVQSAHSLPWRQALSQLHRVLLPLLGVAATRAFAQSALGSYLPTFLSERGASLWLAGASLTVYQAAGSVGVLVGGYLSDRLGRRAIMLGSTSLTPLLLLVFLRLDGAGQFLILLALGFVAVAFDPVAMALVQESGAQNPALATSLYLALMFLMRSLATVAVGALADRVGLHRAFSASAAIFLLGTPLLFLLPVRRSAASTQ